MLGQVSDAAAGETEGVGEMEGVFVALGLWEAVTVGLWVGVRVLLEEGVWEGVWEGVGVGVREGEGEGVQEMAGAAARPVAVQTEGPGQGVGAVDPAGQ